MRQTAARLQARQPQLVAIDSTPNTAAPARLHQARLPRLLRRRRVAPFYGSRWLDRAEAWAGGRPEEKPPMPTVMVAGIAFRAIYLARLLRRAGIQ